jgi:hypothetical protein
MKRGNPVRVISIAAAALFCGALVAACGGHGITPAPNAGPTGSPAKIGHGAIYLPVLPPYSPDAPYVRRGLRALARYCRSARCSANGLPTATQDHWFYLVNGYQLQTPIPGQPGSAPVPQTTPYVLAVSGTAPPGAPAPNGGVSAGAVPLGSTAAGGAELWKLVQVNPGSTAANQRFYLRSAQSFLPLQPSISGSPVPKPVTSPGLYPSLLTGFAASAVNLDLGNLPNWNTGIYMNQNTFPFVGGQTSFQQWYYNASNQTVDNGNGGVLAMTCSVPVAGQSCIGTVAGPSGPTSRWYAYPTYPLTIALAEPTPGPAFPLPSVTAAPNGLGQTDVNGEAAAYYYISIRALGVPSITSLPRCTIPEQTGPAYNAYYGIRCAYINLNDATYVSTCASVAGNSSGPAGAQPYNPTNAALTATISAADWAVVSAQMNSECAYAGGVIGTFNQYNTVLQFIFTQSSSQIGSLSSQIQATQTVNLAPTDLLEGMVVTALSAGGSTLSVLLANLTQTSIDVAQAKRTSLASPIAATSATLYNQLATAITNDQQTLGIMEQGIVWNWKRLKQIGPLTFQDGPNGLGITNGDEAAMEKAGINAYETVFEQIFFPQVYGLTMMPGQTTTTYPGISSYNEYAYPTFGSTKGSSNLNVLCGIGTLKHCPSQSLMAAPTPLPSQAHFALFNGLNGWSALQRTSITFNCAGAMVVLFNQTSNALTVKVTPNAGDVAAPGVAFVAAYDEGAGGLQSSGSKNPYTATLAPYGYTPIYAGATGAGFKLQTTVTISSGSTQVGTFSINESGCSDSSTYLNATGVSTAAGWSFYPAPNAKGAYPSTSTNIVPWLSGSTKGVVFTGSTPSTMWLVIQT